MAQALANNDINTFWKEVHKSKRANSALPVMVDDAQSAESICSLFQLYNSVSFNPCDMEALLIEINGKIKGGCCNNCLHEHEITKNDVTTAIKHVKQGKNDGYLMHYTDHLINGPSKLNEYLAILFKMMVNHGHSPHGFSLASIIPIVKCKRKSPNDSTNYRGIALSSVLSKVLDRIIIANNNESLNSCSCS